MKLLLIDDHRMFREGLASFITKKNNDWEITDSDSIDSAESLLRAGRFDLILSDFHMSGKSLEDLLKQPKTDGPETPVIVISMETDISIITRALSWGIMGWVSKESSSFQVLETIESVLRGNYAFDRTIMQKIVLSLIKQSGNPAPRPDARLTDLSRREREIFDLMSKDISAADIADQLYISRKTVENHRTNIYRKLGVYDRYSLLEFASANRI